MVSCAPCTVLKIISRYILTSTFRNMENVEVRVITKIMIVLIKEPPIIISVKINVVICVL